MFGNNYVNKKNLLLVSCIALYSNTMPEIIGETLFYKASFRGVHAEMRA